MTDELIPAEGISRRDMLKRSAVVGGASAMVWAAPSLTTFSARAFGEEGTKLTGWSHVAFLVTCGGTDYRVKWNREGGFDPGNLAPQCASLDFAADYEAAEPGGSTNAGGNLFTVNPPTQSGTVLRFTITLVQSPSCVIKNGALAGITFQAGVCYEAGTVVSTLAIEFELGDLA